MPVREVEGHTLRLPGNDAAGTGTPRVVRLSLVQRGSFWGPVFNVREFRAEADPEGGLRLLGTGRLLSLRWGSVSEARHRLAERRQLLDELGYLPAPGTARLRGDWDWLRELVERELRSADSAHADRTITEALVGLGLRVDTLIDGLAHLLGLSSHSFRAASVTGADLPPLDALALVLPALAAHHDPLAREVARRWFAHDVVVFDLPGETLERWLTHHAQLGEALLPRLRHHGPALLGLTRLDRLATHSQVSGVQNAARTWLDRVERR